MSAPIPYLDLEAQYLQIADEVERAVGATLASTQFILGPAVEEFEREFASYCGSRHCIAVNSGTSGLHLALLAHDIGAGDEVLTVSMTFVATAAAIRYTGARPRFVDVDLATRTLDPGGLAAAMTPRVKAVVPVHLYGQSADMDPIAAFARDHDLIVIEDAAQAHGAEYHGRRVGSIGAAGCFSFYPGKNLGAYGEGGAVVTDNDELAQRVRKMRDWGQDGKNNFVLPGFNYRMDAIQGAVLGVKLRHLETWTESRIRIARSYDEALADAGVGLATVPAGYRSVYHVYSVLLQDRDAVQRVLGEAGIGTNVHYPVPVHLTPFHADLGYGAGDLPNTERIAREELSLPVYAEMDDGMCGRVVDTLLEALRA